MIRAMRPAVAVTVSAQRFAACFLPAHTHGVTFVVLRSTGSVYESSLGTGPRHAYADRIALALCYHPILYQGSHVKYHCSGDDRLGETLLAGRSNATSAETIDIMLIVDAIAANDDPASPWCFLSLN